MQSLKYTLMRIVFLSAAWPFVILMTPIVLFATVREWWMKKTPHRKTDYDH
jgi:hypothetical protein